MIEEKSKVPNRFRLIDKDGNRYAPFRMKPGVKLSDLIPDGESMDVEIVGVG